MVDLASGHHQPLEGRGREGTEWAQAGATEGQTGGALQGAEDGLSQAQGPGVHAVLWAGGALDPSSVGLCPGHLPLDRRLLACGQGRVVGRFSPTVGRQAEAPASRHFQGISFF